MTKTFWRGKKVFVTGHTGFKGSWLCLWLQDMGAEVTGFALAPSTSPNLYSVAQVGQSMHSLIGDVRDLDALSKAVLQARPEIVIHMAAQALVRQSYQNPVETYATNVMGTVNLLEAIRHVPTVRAVVNVTSDKCYENREWAWGYRENDPMGGHDPYSNSKGCAELVTAAFRNSFFSSDAKDKPSVGLASARAGNVIGGGDWSADRLIPDILKAISENRPVVVRNPAAIRPWQHVLEPLSGYLLLAQRLCEDPAFYADAWNFGPKDEDAKPVQWIVERLIQRWGNGASWKLDQANHPHEANYLKLDCSKARLQLGWSGQWALEDSLEQIVLWQLAFLQGQNMREQTLSQISKFTDQQ